MEKQETQCRRWGRVENAQGQRDAKTAERKAQQDGVNKP